MTVFASPDIAALVAAFPPPSPEKEQPSLVRSRSGNNVVNSVAILDRFRRLLELGPGRIKRSDLPARLGIERGDWLFHCYDGPIHHSNDKRYLITEPEYSQICIDLLSSCEERFTDLSIFASKANVAIESIDDFSHDPDDPDDFRRFRSATEPTSIFVGSQCLVEEVSSKLQSAIIGTDTDKVELTSLLPEVPKVVLRELIKDITNRNEDVQGNLEESNAGVTFVPFSYGAAERKKRLAAFESSIQKSLQSLESDGFCRVAQDNEQSDIIAKRWKDRHPKLQLHTVSRDDPSTGIIVLQAPLDQTLDELQKNVTAFADKVDSRSDPLIDDQIKYELFTASSKPELASILLESEHVKTVEAALTPAVVDRQSKARKAFEEKFQILVMTHIHLYEKGLSTVVDTTLRDRLDHYLSDHFKEDIVPHFTKSARDDDLNKLSKSQLKDLDKLEQSCNQSKVLSDIQSAASKFAKKQKIDGASNDQIKRVKREIIENNVNALQKMKRGSDVLQNLIWILLAATSDGLFISSGKDTSRMIKQYQLVGDEEIGDKLVQWRDALRSGNETTDDIDAMKALGVRTIEKMYGQAVSF